MLSRALVSACFALTVAACSPDGARGRDATVQQPTPRTLTFVIDQLQIDPSDSPSTPHTGFNLDGLYSTELDPGGCTHLDFFSPTDFEQHCVTADEHCTATPGCLRGAAGCRGGVDNQLPTIARMFREVGVDLNMDIGDRITSNQFVLLVRVTNIDDLTNDDSVRVAFYVATGPDGYQFHRRPRCPGPSQRSSEMPQSRSTSATMWSDARARIG